MINPEKMKQAESLLKRLPFDDYSLSIVIGRIEYILLCYEDAEGISHEYEYEYADWDTVIADLQSLVTSHNHEETIMTNHDCNCEKYIKLVEYLYKRNDYIEARIRYSEQQLKEAMERFTIDDIDMVDISDWASELDIRAKELYFINSALAEVGLGAYARIK